MDLNASDVCIALNRPWTPGRMWKHIPLREELLVGNQDPSSTQAQTPIMSLLSRDTGVDSWMCSSVASGVSSEQLQRCSFVLEERHLLLMCFRRNAYIYIRCVLPWQIRSLLLYCLSQFSKGLVGSFFDSMLIVFTIDDIQDIIIKRLSPYDLDKQTQRDSSPTSCISCTLTLFWSLSRTASD